MTAAPASDAATRIARAIHAARTAANGTFTLSNAAAVIRAQLAIEYPKAKRAERPATAPMTDEQWLASLEVMECYSHVDVRRELGKAQAWGTQNGKAISRRRFINWLNKADPTVGYDARGKSSADAQRPKSNAPAGWLATLNRLYPGSTMAPGGAFEIKKETDYAWGQLDAKLRAEIVKAMS